MNVLRVYGCFEKCTVQRLAVGQQLNRCLAKCIDVVLRQGWSSRLYVLGIDKVQHMFCVPYVPGNILFVSVVSRKGILRPPHVSEQRRASCSVLAVFVDDDDSSCQS